MEDRDEREEEDGVEEADKAAAGSARVRARKRGRWNVPEEQLHIDALLVFDLYFEQNHIHRIANSAKQRQPIPEQRILRPSIRRRGVVRAQSRADRRRRRNHRIRMRHEEQADKAREYGEHFGTREGFDADHPAESEREEALHRISQHQSKE